MLSGLTGSRARWGKLGCFFSLTTNTQGKVEFKSPSFRSYLSGIEVVEDFFESDIEPIVKIVSALGELFADVQDFLPAAIGK